MNKTVLVTGGTGSLGQALVGRLLKSGAKKIIVFSRHEAAQVSMRRGISSDRVRFLIGDIRDIERLKRAMDGVDYVFHCAALKHVDVCQREPKEVIATNIVGSMNLIDAAIDCGVNKVLAVSTDKAVSPTCIYGASKLTADHAFVSSNQYSPGKTLFSVVRFGNFEDSSESVSLYFKNLKAQGQVELPITDPNMTRFFISLQDAAKFVLDCLNRMEGGELFTPKMKSMKIVDLAKQIHPDCKLKVVGKRSGEKIHEDLILNYDHTRTFEEDSCFVTYPSSNVSGLGARVPGDFNYRSGGTNEES